MRASHIATAILAAGLLSCSSGEQTEPTRTYQVGERATVGHLIYTVFERQWENQIGQGVAARIPQNKFYLLRISVVNSGSSEVFVPNTQLTDDAGNDYSEAADGEGVQDWIGNTRQVRPSGTLQGYLLFDVPPKHYRLRVFSEDEKQAAFIDIPLSFDTDVPDVTTPLDPNLIPKKKQ